MLLVGLPEPQRINGKRGGVMRNKATRRRGINKTKCLKAFPVSGEKSLNGGGTGFVAANMQVYQASTPLPPAPINIRQRKLSACRCVAVGFPQRLRNHVVENKPNATTTKHALPTPRPWPSQENLESMSHLTLIQGPLSLLHKILSGQRGQRARVNQQPIELLKKGEQASPFPTGAQRTSLVLSTRRSADWPPPVVRCGWGRPWLQYDGRTAALVVFGPVRGSNRGVLTNRSHAGI